MTVKFKDGSELRYVVEVKKAKEAYTLTNVNGCTMTVKKMKVEVIEEW